MATVSKFDEESGPVARVHINDFVVRIAKDLTSMTGRLFEIGPQERTLVR